MISRTRQCSHCQRRKAEFIHPYFDDKSLCPKCFDSYFDHGMTHKNIDVTRPMSSDARINYINSLDLPFSNRIELMEMYLNGC